MVSNRCAGPDVAAQVHTYGYGRYIAQLSLVNYTFPTGRPGPSTRQAPPLGRCTAPDRSGHTSGMRRARPGTECSNRLEHG